MGFTSLVGHAVFTRALLRGEGISWGRKAASGKVEAGAMLTTQVAVLC